MKLKRWIYEHLWQICIYCFAIFTIEIFLLIYCLPLFIHVYVFVCLFLTYGIMIIGEFYYKKKYYQQVFHQLEQLDQKYLLPEVIDNANFSEGLLLKKVIIEMEHSMLEKVNDYKYQNIDYKEYIEMWVHEIKTPLAVTQMIAQNNPNQVMESVKEELDKIEKYIEQALFYARMNYTQKDYLVKKISLKSVVHQVIMKHQKAILNQSVNLNLHDLECEVYSDSKWIEFILNQIIDNSLKYTKQEYASLEIYTVTFTHSIVLMIKDQGIGIKESEINRIFEKGFTGTNGRVNEKSTGIGLYLCHQLSKKLGLSLSIDSKLNEGTTVMLTFPINNMTKM